MVLAASDSGAFLGEDLLPYLVLAMGGALVAGNLAAILKPPAEHRSEDDLPFQQRSWPYPFEFGRCFEFVDPA